MTPGVEHQSTASHHRREQGPASDTESWVQPQDRRPDSPRVRVDQDRAAALTIARMPALIASGSSGQASTTAANPSYGAEAKNSGLSPVFGESLDYISTPACVTREEGCVSVVTVGRQRLGVLVNPPQPSGQSQSKA